MQVHSEWLSASCVLPQVSKSSVPVCAVIPSADGHSLKSGHGCGAALRLRRYPRSLRPGRCLRAGVTAFRPSHQESCCSGGGPALDFLSIPEHRVPHRFFPGDRRSSAVGSDPHQRKREQRNQERKNIAAIPPTNSAGRRRMGIGNFRTQLFCPGQCEQ